MRRNQRVSLGLGISILGALTLSPVLMGQARDSKASRPMISDWSNHHVIFSKPATAERAELVEQDPRYWQQIRRRAAAVLPEVETRAALASALRSSSRASSSVKKAGLGRDWAQDMGPSATVGAANYPAKFSFDEETASCANDFIVYNTGLLGSTGPGGQPSILAYNNVYTACEGDGSTAPAVYWAFNTGGQIQTSPEFSRDGSQLAFVQTSGGVANLVLLKWQAGSGLLIDPVAPTSVANALYHGCAAPCMTTFALATTDSNSSPFYDYGSDALYVGDDSGLLHKFTPVFNAAPAEVTSGWPVQVSPLPATPLTNPVHDSVTGNVFVEDVGGFLYLVKSTGAVIQSGQLDFSIDADGGPGFVQGPIVDSSAGLVYAFATSDGSGSCASVADCSAVYLFTTHFTSNDIGSEATVGSSSIEPAVPNPMYIGAFDNEYENSLDPPTGNLYVCGDTGLNPILYRIPISAGAFIGHVATVATPTPALDNPSCSPVSDISNPNTPVGATVTTFERVFFSVQDNGVPTLCGRIGCALSFVDLPWQASTHYDVGQEVLVFRANNTPFIQVAIVAGNTAATQPTWPLAVGTLTPNGVVTWLNQGAATLTPLATWQDFNPYALHARIVDKFRNVEIVTKAGTSGALTPAWSTTAGGTTTADGTVTWINAGPLPSAALTSTGGTSGFIIDNVVNPLTFAGASEVYFSTLQDQTCVAGTGGCAVQASQAELQ